MKVYVNYSMMNEIDNILVKVSFFFSVLSITYREIIIKGCLIFFKWNLLVDSMDYLFWFFDLTQSSWIQRKNCCMWPPSWNKLASQDWLPWVRIFLDCCIIDLCRDSHVPDGCDKQIRPDAPKSYLALDAWNARPREFWASGLCKTTEFPIWCP